MIFIVWCSVYCVEKCVSFSKLCDVNICDVMCVV